MSSADHRLHGIDPAAVRHEYQDRRLGDLPDARLVEAAAAIIARPKVDAPDSFVLHAPLELLARGALLTHVSPGARLDAGLRIVWLAATYDAAGPSTDVVPGAHHDADGAIDLLLASIAAGDLDTAGAVGAWLGRNLDATDLSRAVGDGVVASLAAAAHGAIYLHLLPRCAPRSPLAGALFGNLARELARNPAWALTWMDETDRADGDLVAALAGTPVLGRPGSDFIHPLMDQAERSGLAADIVGPAVGPDVDARRATVDLLRVATASMLLETPEYAPYGWSHCLTIPQATASIAPLLRAPDRALAVAATHIVGFRAGLGSAPLRELARGRLSTDGTLPIAGPDADELQAVIDHAAVHPDAHLAKYVVACLDAARTDPDAAGQHLAAAVHLDRWWIGQPVTDDPVLATTPA